MSNSEEITPGSYFPVMLSGSGTVTYSDAENPAMQGTITVGGASQTVGGARGGEAAIPEENAGEPAQTIDDSTPPVSQ